MFRAPGYAPTFPVTEPQRHALERVKRNQEDLLRLINDVLHFARLEAGRLEVLVDEFTRESKSLLSSPPEAMYPDLVLPRRD